MHSARQLMFLLIALLLLLLPPVTAAAASFEFTVTAKTAFDKMLTASDKATASKLTKQFADLQALQKQDTEWDTKINNLHYRNDEAILLTRARIKEIDAAKLAKLDAEVKKAKDKYQPLFDLYDSLNQQLKVAKSFKNKTLVSLLQPQVETTKAVVQLAKQDIRNKEAALKSAKTAATASMKKIKEILATIDSVKVKIKAAKSTVSSTNKQFKTEGTILNQVVRKGDTTAALSSFTRLIAFMRQIIEQKQKTYSCEQQISAIIAKADTQMAAK